MVVFQPPGTAPPFTRRCGLFRFSRKPTTDHDPRNQLPPEEQRPAPAVGHLHARAVREDDSGLVVHLVAGRHEHLADAPGAAAQEPAGVFDVPMNHGTAGEAPVEAVEAAGQLRVARGHLPGERPSRTTADHVHLAEVDGCRVETAGGTERAGTQHDSTVDRDCHRSTRFRRHVPIPTNRSTDTPAEGRGSAELAIVQEHLVPSRPPRISLQPPARSHATFQHEAGANHTEAVGSIEPETGTHQRHDVQEILGRPGTENPRAGLLFGLAQGVALGGDHQDFIPEGVLADGEVPLETPGGSELPICESQGVTALPNEHRPRLTEVELQRQAHLHRRVAGVEVGQPGLQADEVRVLQPQVGVVRELRGDLVEALVGERDVAAPPGRVGGTPVGGRVDILQVHAEQLLVLGLDAAPLLLTRERVGRALLDVGQEDIGRLDLDLVRDAGQGGGGQGEAQQQADRQQQGGGLVEQFLHQVQHCACPRGGESKLGIRGRLLNVRGSIASSKIS